MTETSNLQQCVCCKTYFDPAELHEVIMMFDFEENGGVTKVPFTFCSDSECEWTRRYFELQAKFTSHEPMTRSKALELSRIALGEN